MASVFPAPDHDHGRCSADTLRHAEALCAKRGERLTPMRRQVLEVLAASHRPVGAYEIIDAVAARGPRPAPITVYRALDFLTAQGLAHRIESRNAFLACINNHASDAPVFEWSDEPVAVNAHDRLVRLAKERGWRIEDWG